ncbi:GH25 family lysozyme, partial [Enterococcus faecalis]
NDLNGARAQALYAVESAKIMGLPGGSYLATDWETGTGASYNNVSGGKSKNTQAVLLTMDVIASAGYKPLLYSGAYLLKSNIDTSVILSHYPNSLWVASYPTSNAVSTANMNYFPAISGVALWQFTDNWNGMHTDASIAVIDSDNKNNAEGDEDMGWHPEINVTELGRFKVTRPDGAQLY